MNALPYTTTSASFTQPSSGSTISVTVYATGSMSASQVLYVDNGGYYTVSSVTDGTHVVLTNLGSTGNASSSTNIPSGSQVSAVSPGDVTGVLPASNQQPQTLTGDVGGTTDANILATVNSDVGTYGDATHVAQVTVNAKGLVTAASALAISVTGPILHTVTFTSSTTWTAPTGVSQIVLSGCGGGGGGGGGQPSVENGGGGGGGACLGFTTIPVTAGNTYTVTIGAGGSGGSTSTQGSVGGKTQLTDGGSNIYANFPGASGGGAGGGSVNGGGSSTTSRGANITVGYGQQSGVPVMPGQGGFGGVNNLPGLNGADAASTHGSGAVPEGGAAGSGNGSGGGGGAGTFGPGATGGNGYSTSTAGSNASANTGAGGGGGGADGTNAQAGGNGGSGYLIIQYWV